MNNQDVAILNLLQGDASLSVGDIADRVNLSKSACWRKIQKLEADGVIKSRVTLLDQEKVNLPLTVFVSIRTNQHNNAWATSFRQLIEQIPAVLEVYRMSGDLDYLLRAVVADMPGYDSLYQQLIQADLFDVSSSFVMETMKHTTQLPLSNLAK